MIKPLRKLSNSFKKRKNKLKKLLYLLSWNQYRINVIEGLQFDVRRYFRQRRNKTLHKPARKVRSVGYPVINDYEKGLVSIAILSKDGYKLIRPCIESIETYRGKYEIEIIIGDTGTQDKEVLAYYLESTKKFKNIRIVSFGKYCFSKNYNDLIFTQAGGEYVVLLNNDTIAKPGWLDALVAPLEDRRVGIVGAKLLNKDGTIQHAGIEYNDQGNGYHVFRNEPSDLPAANVASIVPGVTFACVAMRHDVYDRFRLNVDFVEEAQDTDFCLRLHDAGFAILYEPKAELFHFEGSSRDWRKGAPDTILLRERWGEQILELSRLRIQRMPFDMEAYRDAIVVIRDDGIGDLLMGVSSFQKIRETYPERKLVLLTYQRNMAMMERFGIFDKILPIPDGKKYSPLPVPSKNTIEHNLIDIEMKFGGTFAETKEANKVHRHIAFTRKFGLDESYSMIPMPEYPEAKARVHEILCEMDVSTDSPFVVFNLIATNPARSWWEPYYPELIAAVEKMGYLPVLIGTKGSPYFKETGAVNLVGKTITIPEYIEALKLGKYVISSDTSACHVAGLSDIPFLAIFTGGVLASARLNYYQKYEVIEPQGLACYPCWDVGCRDRSVRWKKEPCRLMLTPDKVIEQFRKLTLKYPEG
jgi:GT2 family glycosyltransferase/ADP-heptose:LPS heptosyltransferase